MRPEHPTLMAATGRDDDTVARLNAEQRPPRPGPTIDDDPRWTAVSPGQPCPICGGTETGCGIALDGRVVDCGRVPSEHPLEGGGWLHSLPGAQLPLDEPGDI